MVRSEKRKLDTVLVDDNNLERQREVSVDYMRVRDYEGYDIQHSFVDLKKTSKGECTLLELESPFLIKIWDAYNPENLVETDLVDKDVNYKKVNGAIHDFTLPAGFFSSIPSYTVVPSLRTKNFLREVR